MELLAFFAPDALSRETLDAEPEALPEGLHDKLARNRAIGALNRFSLLRAEAGTLTVHRFVQAVTRDGLDAATAKTHADAAVRLVGATLPRPPWEHTNWPAIGALLPHALATAEAAERLEAGLKTAATVLNETALYHKARAAYAEAEPLHKRAIAIDEKALSPEHPGLATDLNEAEPLHKRAIAIGEKTLPPDHPHQMWGRENYAHLLDQLGRHTEAAELHAPTQAIR